MKALALVLLAAATGCAGLRPKVEARMAQLQSEVDALEYTIGTMVPAEEHSEPIASVGTWVPARVAKSALLAQAEPPSFGGRITIPAEFTGDLAAYSTKGTGVTLGTASSFPGIWFLGGGSSPNATNYAIMNAGPLLINGNGNGVVVRDANTATVATFQAANGMQLRRLALPTCNSATEGYVLRDVLAGGTTTSKVSKLCFCVSDGTSTYTWRNTLTNTNGTSTTCGTE